MSRKPCCVGEGLKKGAWTTEEDKKLISYIHEHGEGGWRDIPQKAARHLPRRTDNEIKNYWNTHLKKRLIEQGVDPVTHKPLASNSGPTATTPPENLHFLDESSSDKQYSRSSSMPSLSRLPSSGFNTVSEIASNVGTPVQVGSLSCKKRFKKSSSTSRLLNKFAAKATSIKDILSASMEGSSSAATTISHASFLNGFSEQSRNEEDSSNASLTNTLAEFDPFSQSSLYPEHEINVTSDIGMDQVYDFSQFLEKLGSEGHNELNVEYGHDLLMSDVSQEVSSPSVDDQDNMIGSFEGWSNYLLDHADFIYDTDSDSLEKHFIICPSLQDLMGFSDIENHALRINW
ncbi:unnamed protein product [Thlaspi arvense]|uniref:Uncharacterized protein n=1 Tax=Thlaspi arvense TaxID=13288 RepID=A0AAU9RP21_THLAR|nr:unnamed protein product [Thlaspi arvense]